MDKIGYAVLGLANAADDDADRQKASREFYAALRRVKNRDLMLTLEASFNGAWVSAADAVAKEALQA
jgi:hypothetical protein